MKNRNERIIIDIEQLKSLGVENKTIKYMIEEKYGEFDNSLIDSTKSYSEKHSEEPNYDHQMLEEHRVAELVDKNEKKKKIISIVFTIIILSVLIISFLFNCVFEPITNWEEKGLMQGAFHYSKIYVGKFIKHPALTTFPEFDYDFVEFEGTNKYKICSFFAIMDAKGRYRPTFFESHVEYLGNNRFKDNGTELLE